MNSNLIQLCHHRWAIPILGELHRQNGGSKFVTLVNRLSISRDALSRTLEALLELNLIERNTVYAHPLRPEYILAQNRQELARFAFILLEQAQNHELLLKKWTLPLLDSLQDQNSFSKLKKALPSITSRALSLGLNDLIELGYLEQDDYQMTEAGKSIAVLVGEIKNYLGEV